MSCQRPSFRRALFVSPVILSALILLAALPVPATAAARTPSWTREWRPGWLPGDPEVVPDPDQLPVWAPGATRAAGLLIAIDPVTRRPIAPTAEQKRAFVEQLNARDALQAPTAPLRVERLPGGGEIIHLNGAYQVYSIARRDASGRFVTECVPDPTVARTLLAKPVTPKTPPPATHWEER